MTWQCTRCDVNWWPYQCKEGKNYACPECGGGLRPVHVPGSLDADARYKAAQARRLDRERSENVHAEFERFYARRERQALEATLEEIRALPAAEPDRQGARGAGSGP